MNPLEIKPAPTEDEAAAIAAALTAFAAQARARPYTNGRWQALRFESAPPRMTWTQTARAEALDAGL